MTTVVPCSTSTISLIPGAAFTLKKNNNPLTRCSLPTKSSKRIISSQRHVLPLLTSVGLFPQYRRDHGWLHRSVVHSVPATGTDTDVVVDEAGSLVTDENSGGASDIPAAADKTSEKSSIKAGANLAPAQSKRSRPGRKSEMPSVKNEDLVPGASFTGKVRSIQPFGAFVDFGAFTDGLVHVSRLSNSFVKDVGSVVSVGQEVTVTLVEVNTEAGRISLSMRESDDTNKLQQQKDTSATATSGKPRPARRNTSKSGQKRVDIKSSKFVVGQELEGTVKNLTRSGSFISLPEGEEGFLPTSEESDGGLESMMGGSSLEVGQEVTVRVLRVARGQFTLTMKKEEAKELNTEVIQGVVHAATNPFVLAFRKNKDIASFLDDRDKMEKVSKQTLKLKKPLEIGQEKQTETMSDVPEFQGQPSRSNKGSVSGASTVIETAKDEASSKEVVVEPGVAGDNENPESVEPSSSQIVENAVKTDVVPDIPEVRDQPSSNEGSVSVTSTAIETEKDEASSKEVVEEPGIAGDNEDTESIEPSSSQLVGAAVETDVLPDIPEVQDQSSRSNEESVSVASTVIKTTGDEASSKEVAEEPSIAGVTEDPEGIETSSLQSVEGAVETVEKEIEESSGISDSEGSISTAYNIIDEASVSDGSGSDGKSSSSEISSEIASLATPVAEVAESQLGDSITNDEVQSPSTENDISSIAPVEDESPVATAPDENSSITGSDGEESIENSDPSESTGEAAIKSSESQDIAEVVQNQVESTKDEVQTQASAAEAEIPSAIQVENEKEEPSYVKNDSFANSNGQSDSSSTEKSVKATISPALVKQLREETGAGMMDCKKALSETGGDIVKAQEFLRKKGLASAEKKASRATAEGRIGSYIHDSRIGVLVEVNCETDFVSRGEIFKELVDDIAMQVAACPQVQYLDTEDVPEEIVNKEREIEMQKEDLLSKPEQIRSKIVEGRIRKRLEELALLEQPYIKNDKIVLKDLVKQTIATIGENMKVRRFVRFNLGEGLEKKSQDFAAEVAAQTTAKPVAAPTKEQSASAETKEPVEKPPVIAVSAALVKQLREETGAGMMDCKRALSETGGNIEKAQEYLRKKGLSAADKKSSRLAAEGRIGSYIHDSRIGVLIEVNCETDFVGRSEKFKELVNDLAMQVVACPQVQYVSIDEIPETIRNKEKELEMQREDLTSKPENIREKIVEGRVSKRLGELALLEQAFIKDDSVLVKDLVKQTVASIGENIKVRRFVRFTLGEKTEDAKAETEAQEH